MQATRTTVKGTREIAEMIHSLILGSETAAAAMTWCLADALHEPDARVEVESEIAATFGDRRPAAASYPDMPFLDALVQESLRLHPVLAWIWRTPEEPIRLSGHLVPRGVMVLPAPYLANRDPRRWEEPGAFRPRRFLGRSYDSATFFPFGAGSHGCPGAAMALPILKHFLVRTLQLTRLRAARSRLPTSRIDVATASPSDGLRVVDTSNRQAA
jgi:cytochrome P450